MLSYFILSVLKKTDNMKFFFNLNIFNCMNSLFHVAGRWLETGEIQWHPNMIWKILEIFNIFLMSKVTKILLGKLP